MRTKVTGFVGSPRRGGNTDILVRRMLEGAEKAGADTSIFYLNEIDFKGCQGCRYCKVYGRCRLDDGMTAMYQALIESDAIIIGSPVFFGQMSGQTKCFLDRWYALVNPDFSSQLADGKKIALVFPQGDQNPTMYEGMATHFAVTMEFFGLKVIETLVAPGLMSLGDAEKDTALMKKAFSIGKKLVETK